MKVQQLMSKQPEFCGPNHDLAAAAMIMWRSDCGVVPVVDPATNRTIGVLTDRDICMAVATQHRRAAEIRVREVMSGRLISVHPQDDIRAAMDAMKSERVRRLPVVDADDHLQGVLSISDLLLSAQAPVGRTQPDVPMAAVLDVLKVISHRDKVEVMLPRHEEVEAHVV